MRATLRLYLILITLTVILFSWITNQLGNPRNQVLIAVLAGGSFIAFILLNIADQREARRKRKIREARPSTYIRPGEEKPNRPNVDYSLKEKKSGLTWGGGNIKASEATRGTRRKFLGK